MSNLARHKEYYLRGWRSNIRAEIELDNGLKKTETAAEDENEAEDQNATFKSVDRLKRFRRMSGLLLLSLQKSRPGGDGEKEVGGSLLFDGGRVL